MKKFLSFFIAIIMLSGCTSLKNDINVDVSTSSSENATSKFTESTQQSEQSVTSADVVSADVPEVELTEISKVIQAEEGISDGGVKLSQERDGYEGVGYMTGFDKNPSDDLEMSVLIPSNQHYNITVVLASDNKMNNILTVNGQDIGELVTTASGKFEPITLRNVYLTKGVKQIGIKQVTGGIDVDYVYIQNSDDITNLDITPDDTPINENSDTKTKNTMKYLADNFNENIISGQYATPGTNKELDLIYQTTGHYPALRLGDMATYTDDKAPKKEIEKAIEWSARGGLVGYVWHWKAPTENGSYYSDSTDFDLSKAVTDIDIANMSQDEIEKLYDDGEISKECFDLVRDIDTVSQKLEILKDNGVTVLWRPLHEASGGWFWWGAKGFDSYEWLWNLIYERQTQYFDLNNLIWVWNAQDTDWYVGDDKCDIISADVYAVDGSQISEVNTYIQLAKISSKKLIALSECSAPPAPNAMLRDRAMWSWFGVWYGDYVMDTSGEISEEYISKDDLIKTYSHENIITLEQLPDLRD